MGEIVLQEQTRRLLEDPVLGEQDVDTKVRSLVEAEYLRRLARYQQTDHDLGLKYGMTFDDFTARRVVQRTGHTWEAESDAMHWETAIGGIRTMTAKLNELRGLAHV